MVEVPIKPILEDPANEKEVFANEVAGIALVHGNVVVTLANVRFEETIENQPPKARRVVAGRIVLTNPAAVQLLQSLKRLAAQLEAAAAPVLTNVQH
jgi:hypothetical protein